MMELSSAEALEDLGRKIAGLVRQGDVIALSGDLGAGKTTLARGLLAGLGLKAEAPSPTFTLVQSYGPPEVRLPVCHADLYRLEHPAQSQELGLEEAEDEGLVLIEWPERLGDWLSPQALWLRLEGAPGPTRTLTARVPQAWEGRWPPR